MIVAALVLCLAILVYISGRIYKSGVQSEKLKNEEAINDQNDELLEYLKKQKLFCDRVKSNREFRDRVRGVINDELKK